MPDAFYRFRSAAALLGSYEELERQEIFFSLPDHLNDPMEGFKNVVWTGDPIVWRSLFNHYLLCLIQATSELMLLGPDFTPQRLAYLAQMTDEDLPDAPVRDVLKASREAFFGFSVVDTFIDGVVRNRLKLKQHGLRSYLRSLHPLALKAVHHGFQRHRNIELPPFLAADISPFDDPERMSQMLEGHAASGASADFAFQAAESASTQLDLINDIRRQEVEGHSDWMFIARDFPRFYVDMLPSALFPAWATACFVTDPGSPAMWGVYGDGHKGACLIFKSTPQSDGRETLALDWTVGLYQRDAEPRIVSQKMNLEFTQVQYANEYPEVDFFTCLSGLSRSKLIDFWYRGEDGSSSPAADQALCESEEARTAYWQRHGLITTTKLEGWRHECEHRLVLTSNFHSHGDSASRKLRYRFGDLAGIGFGMKMAHADKLEIIRIIARKARAEGRNDFEFFQAEHDSRTGQIRLSKLSLLTLEHESALPSP